VWREWGGRARGNRRAGEAYQRAQEAAQWRVAEEGGDRAGAASYTAARRGKALADAMGETSCLRTVAELAPRGAMVAAAAAA